MSPKKKGKDILQTHLITGGELIQVPGTCIERVKLIDPGFSKIKKVMGVLVLNSYLLTTNNGSLFHSRIGECSSSARRAREGHEPIRE